MENSSNRRVPYFGTPDFLHLSLCKSMLIQTVFTNSWIEIGKFCEKLRKQAHILQKTGQNPDS